MTLLLLVGAAIVVFLAVFIVGAMAIGYIVENRTGAGYVLLGAIAGALLAAFLRGA